MKTSGLHSHFQHRRHFVRYIHLASATIALCRGVLGCAFLLVMMAMTGKKPNFANIRRNSWVQRPL